jgi:hypothetical protein
MTWLCRMAKLAVILREDGSPRPGRAIAQGAGSA